eukprot:CAMPEP_0171113416 /NCGR_PEP_ID=MMETSP0766_2-20121228/82334_1 /TAXON_ID=439317 /ORGANISM="Gambierdiscus australes, Strain CAWD 149" /LENGTH=90 /DNA_ID=CAMNT_0011575617 /DNA_START=119 /DNA_END=388 /DNA_ORIENTATION=-
MHTSAHIVASVLLQALLVDGLESVIELVPCKGLSEEQAAAWTQDVIHAMDEAWQVTKLRGRLDANDEVKGLLWQYLRKLQRVHALELQAR